MPQKKESSKPTRRTGGQPGNWNAFKHGYYSRRYRPLEISDLSTMLSDDLQNEIALLRVIIRRVFEIANDNIDQDLDTWSHSLNTLGAASTRLAGLLRTNQLISGSGTDALDVLSKAFGEVAHELGYPDPSANRNSIN